MYGTITNIKVKLLVVGLGILGFSSSLSARNNPNGNKGGGDNLTPAAGCASAVAITSLELNNVRARIEGTGGSMWQDRANTIAAYNVPRQQNSTDPLLTSIFAGALWMGGTDVNGQLKIAAVTFRTAGNDFWPGPLNTTTADIDPATCAKFDEFFEISRPEVDQFVAWYQAGLADPAQQAIDFPGYQVPASITNWPGNGDVSLGQDPFLAPFFDRDGDGFYDPGQGDYPKYDLEGVIDCRTQRDVRLFGDQTIWWVFNDKGNPHTESQGPSIGMEIRGQAFAFATNDEVNNMTFYNYEMINRSTFTLTNTYFGQWVDADLGNSGDDYVGCDAERGLGYCYNGDPLDEDNAGVSGYGTTPPVIGVDFFEGPFADNDGIDNPLTTDVALAIAQNGIPYSGLGIGYGDGIVDNERYGMRKFIYYNRSDLTSVPGDGDPSSALQYYNYLQGIWRNGSNMVWSGNGNQVAGGTVFADLLFPGDSDPLFWSTQGVAAAPTNWSEFNAAASGTPNTPSDRRFLESAGPFTLEPGAVNDLTVGVLYARATSGDNLASIDILRVADDKAQSLFDNCFKITEGPDAPEIAFQELDRELILYLSNPASSNNANEGYRLKDPFIAIPDVLNGVTLTDAEKEELKFYEFQGYQIYQVKNGLITVSELDDDRVARLAAQVDIKDGITQLVNHVFDENLGANVPTEEVNGADEGIKHSFRFTEDLFAEGDNRLINHKTYHYIAIAYGYNEFKRFDPLDPAALDGQRLPYIGSRTSALGGGIRSFSAIPHDPSPENQGTLAQSSYGDMPQITRIEGQGNGGNNLDLLPSSVAGIVDNGFEDFITYRSGRGPINVQVVDPLNVKAGVYRVRFTDFTADGDLEDAFWVLDLPTGDTILSNQSIMIENEQLILDEGISISIRQSANAGEEIEIGNGALVSSIEYANPSAAWLTGFSDQDGQTDANWIRSGESIFDGTTAYNDYQVAGEFVDPMQDFEGVLGGTFAPYGLASSSANDTILDALVTPVLNGAAGPRSRLSDVPSVDIVFTNDQSKWSRSMVFEARNDVNLAENGAGHLELRESPSVGKDGDPDASGTTGMGWFPGYAINLETGERLNIAFAEDSWLAGENGRDMKWNPTSTTTAGVGNELRIGGKHYIYVFREGFVDNFIGTLPAYDESAALYNLMSSNVALNRMLAMSSCAWTGIPLLEPGRELIETETTVKLRVEREYNSLTTASTVNGGLPMYEFDMSGLEVFTNNDFAADSALALINVVPNPYFAFSDYETDQLDNRIKVTNLPEECTISIYNVNGTLMRRFAKADPKTSLDWDLKNSADVPVAGGVYLIHVEVPNVGERTLKWFGVIKPTDLNGF